MLYPWYTSKIGSKPTTFTWPDSGKGSIAEHHHLFGVYPHNSVVAHPHLCTKLTKKIIHVVKSSFEGSYNEEQRMLAMFKHNNWISSCLNNEKNVMKRFNLMKKGYLASNTETKQILLMRYFTEIINL